MEQESDHQEGRLRKEQGFLGWLWGRRSSQITVTRTLAITFSAVLAVTFAAAMYSIVNVHLQESGWDVEGAQASSSPQVAQVVVEKNLEVKEKLEVKRDLEVTRDLRLLGEGSVLDMRGSLPCRTEEEAPRGTGRLCFDGVANRFRISENGGPFVDLSDTVAVAVPGLTGAAGSPGPVSVPGLTGAAGSPGPLSVPGLAGAAGSPGPQGVPGVQGAPGALGPAGPAGPAGLAGPQGIPGVQGVPGSLGPAGPSGVEGPAGGRGPAGAPGVSCWDLNQDGQLAPVLEDRNQDGVGNAWDCQGGVSVLVGTARVPAGSLAAASVTIPLPEGFVTLLRQQHRLNVQLTSRGQWTYLYFVPTGTAIQVYDNTGRGGEFDYLIQVLPPGT